MGGTLQTFDIDGNTISKTLYNTNSDKHGWSWRRDSDAYYEQKYENGYLTAERITLKTNKPGSRHALQSQGSGGLVEKYNVYVNNLLHHSTHRYKDGYIVTTNYDQGKVKTKTVKNKSGDVISIKK